MKIINLSDCGLSAVGFLRQCEEVEFVNINHNRVRQLTPLKDMKYLVELHCFENQLEGLPLSNNLHKYLLQKLRLHIIDVGANLIADIETLVSFKSITTLKILNVTGNPLCAQRSVVKKELPRMFPQVKGFEFPEVYVTTPVYLDIFQLQPTEGSCVLH